MDTQPIEEIAMKTAGASTQTAPAHAQAVAPTGAWQWIKANLNPEVIMKKYNISWENTRQYLIYFVAGFAVGFLVKRFLGALLILLVIAIGALYGLEYLNIATINWSLAYTHLGLPATTTLGTLFSSSITWVRQHLAISILWFIGFVIGYKVG